MAVPEWVPTEPRKARRGKKGLLWIGAICLVAFLVYLSLPRSSSRTREDSAVDAERHDSPSQAPLVNEELAHQVRDKLATFCYRCHGENGAMEGGFNYLMDRDRLIARKKIVPVKPEQSRLLQRILDGEMPPEEEAKRPDVSEIALLRRWIETGAPAFIPSTEQRVFLANADMIRSIRTDLA